MRLRLDNTALEIGRRDGPRLLVIDSLRGAAVAAMVVYHTAWDLSALQLIETDVLASRAWMGFARTIAASFLTLAGIGLVLADRAGGSRAGDSLAGGRPVFLRRLAVIGLAAAIVTLATVFVFPDSFIFFGVLHNIAVSSLLALPFLRVPAIWSIVGALVLWTAPLATWPPLFDAPWLYPLGLGGVLPETNDYVPIAPWTGFVLAGSVLARLAGPVLARRGVTVAPLRPPGRGLRVLAAIGRRSLLIYLLHQPLIFGALWGLRELTGPNPVAEALPFTRQCTASCGRSEPESVCRASCECAVDALKREALWRPVVTNRVTPDELSRAQGLFVTCLKAARP